MLLGTIRCLDTNLTTAESHLSVNNTHSDIANRLELIVRFDIVIVQRSLADMLSIHVGPEPSPLFG